MKRFIFALAVASLLLTAVGRTDAAHPHHYGQVGVQTGFYRYPGPGGYGSSVGVQTGFYRYPAPGYSPGGGCYGGCYGGGYSPAPIYPAPVYPAPAGCSGGCYGGGYGAGYGYAPMPYLGVPPAGYGYSPGYSPGYVPGHYSPGQAGLFPIPGLGGLGILDLLRAVKDITEAVEQFRGGRTDSDTKKALEDLRKEVAELRAEVKAKEIPPNLGTQLKDIQKSVDALAADLAEYKKALKDAKVFPKQ